MANFVPMKIAGAWIIDSQVYGDERGFFREWFQSEVFENETGLKFAPVQANLSRSAKGVVRGIHFSRAHAGQSKLVTCANGRVLDVVVDIRPDSPTFKSWEAIELDPSSGRSVFIGHGLGHAFLALEDESVVTYLLSSPYSPTEEFEVNPFDEEIGIKWPASNLSLSKKDAAAPTLSAFLAGLAPINRLD